MLVWRAALAKTDEIRALELRLHTAGEAQFTQAMLEVMQASPELLEPPAQLSAARAAAAARAGTHG